MSPYFASPTKEGHERLGAAIAEGAEQQLSCSQWSVILITQ